VAIISRQAKTSSKLVVSASAFIPWISSRLGRRAKTSSKLVVSAGTSCIYCSFISHLIIVIRGVSCACPWSISTTGKIIKNTNCGETGHPRSDPHGRTRKSCCITSVSPGKFHGRRVAAASCAYDILPGSSARSGRAARRHCNACSAFLGPLWGFCVGNWLGNAETGKRQNAGNKNPEKQNQKRYSDFFIHQSHYRSLGTS